MRWKLWNLVSSSQIRVLKLQISQIRGTGKTRPYVRKLILHNNKFEFMAQSLFTSSSEVFLLEKRDIVKSVFLPGQVNFKIK